MMTMMMNIIIIIIFKKLYQACQKKNFANFSGII